MDRFHLRTVAPGITAVVWVLLVVASAPSPVDATVDLASEPRLTMTALTADQEFLVGWAVALFEDAGLGLPPVDFVGSENDAPCQGRLGAARWNQGRSEISLCTDGAGGVEEMLVVHELAHAWDRHDLQDDRRQDFLEVRGLQQWRGDAEWHDRGAEHAASIITWGLMDRPVRPGHISGDTCAELQLGYETLTGRPPLHGFHDLCDQRTGG